MLSYLHATLLLLKRAKAKSEISKMCQKLRFIDFIAIYNEKPVAWSKVRFDRNKLWCIKCLD